MTAQTDLSDRYGAPAPWRRAVLLGLSVAVAGAFLGWLGWTIWAQSTPKVESELVGFDVIDEHEATAVVSIQLGDDVEATCLLRAYAEDHSVVGELQLHPRSQRSHRPDRAHRAAGLSVELMGCTAEGQSRPR